MIMYLQSRAVHMDDVRLYLQQRIPTVCENRQGGGPGDKRDTCTAAYYPMDGWMHLIRDHRPSAEVKDSAKPAGRAGMLPLLSSRLMTLPPPASASCQLFTICSSGRCRSMPR
jgi:hypothetical protein